MEWDRGHWVVVRGNADDASPVPKRPKWDREKSERVRQDIAELYDWLNYLKTRVLRHRTEFWTQIAVAERHFQPLRQIANYHPLTRQLQLAWLELNALYELVDDYRYPDDDRFWYGLDGAIGPPYDLVPGESFGPPRSRAIFTCRSLFVRSHKRSRRAELCQASGALGS